MLNNQNKKLIRRYVFAMINMYGIIPLRHAYHIFAHQNPLLEVSEDDFWEFTSYDQGNQAYNVAAESDILNKEVDEDQDEEFYLYGDWVLMDLPQDFDRIRLYQKDRVYYVPEPEEFLRRENEWYYERTNGTENYRKFLKKIKPDISPDMLESGFFETLAGFHSLSFGETEPQIMRSIVRSLNHLSFNISQDNKKELSKLLKEMLLETRQEALRGMMYKDFESPTALEIVKKEGLSDNVIDMIHTGEIDAIEIANDIDDDELKNRLIELYKE